MNQLTLRQIPRPVERRLREAARRSGKSMNRTAVEILGRGLGLEPEEKPKKKRDVSSVFRKWSARDQREFERRTEGFGAIDEEMWRT